MANNFLIDAAARQAHWVERYKNRTANVAVESLAAVKKAILAEVASGDISSLEAVQELQSVVDEILSAGLSETMGDFSGELKEFGSTQAVFEAATIGKAAKETAKIITPTAAQIWAVANTRPFATKLLRQTFSDFTADAKKLIKNQIQTAFFEGYTLPDLVKSLKGSPQMGLADGAFGSIERKLKLTIRTSISHLASSARDKVYQENSNVVTGVEWVATLDTKTSPVCRGLDGQIFPVDSGQRPPAHPNCRSTTIPVINPDLLLNPDSTGIRPAKGADGRETVSGKETYDSWLRKQPDDFQADVMGEKKAKLFRDGELKMDKFVDDGRELSLVQLQERYPKAWAKAGMDDKPTKIVPPVKPKAKPEIKPKAKPATKTKTKGAATGVRSTEIRPSKVRPANFGKAKPLAVKWYESGIKTDTYDKILDRIELPEHIGGSKGGAYYRGEFRGTPAKIKMGDAVYDHDGGGSTYRHELGHHVDYTIASGRLGGSRLFTDNRVYKDAIQGDFETYTKQLGSVSKKMGLKTGGNITDTVKDAFKKRAMAGRDNLVGEFSEFTGTLKDFAEQIAAENFENGSMARRIFDLYPFDFDLNGGDGFGDKMKLRFLAGLIEANKIDSNLLHIQNVWDFGALLTKTQRGIFGATDTLEAVSMAVPNMGRMGGGHGFHYFSRDYGSSNRKESFANIFSAFSPESDRVVLDLIESIAPNQVRIVEGLLNGE